MAASSYMKPNDFVGKMGKYPFPSRELSPEEKQKKDYFLAMNRAVFTDYSNGYCAVPFYWGDQRSIPELDAYATGRQGNSKIKPWLLPKSKKNKDGTWTTKMNVSWDIYAKVPQLLDMMMAKNIPHDFDPEFTCIDDDSIAAVESAREAMKFMLEDETKKFLKWMQFKPMDTPDPEMLGIQTSEEVDMFVDTGGYSLQWQMAALAAFKRSKVASKYKEFQDRIFRDIITNPEGICGAKITINNATHVPEFRRVDMAYAVLPHSQYNNFKNITWAGELRYMTIAEIHQENPELTSRELLQLAKDFQWMNPGYVNAVRNAEQRYGTYAAPHNNPFDIDPVSRCKILVMDMQWLSVDLKTNLKNDNTGIYKPVDFDYEIDKKAAKNGDYKVQNDVIKKYESIWVVGTDKFIRYGQCENVAYFGEKGDKTPRLDYKFAKHGNMSLIERLVAIADDMHMILVKYRNAWATLPAAPAMVIQKNLIENVFMNGELQQPEDLYQAFIEKGIMMVNGLDDHGDPLYAAGGMKPIDYADVSKMAQMLTLCSNELRIKVDEMREVLGLQNGADGGSTSPYQGLGETEIAIQQGMEALLPSFNAYNYLFEDIVDDTVHKWQMVAKEFKGMKIPYSLLGEKNMKMLELGKEFCSAAFAIQISISPSLQEKQAFLMSLQQMRALGQQSGGSQGLSTAEYMFVYDKVSAGLMKQAYWILGKIEQRKLRDARAVEERNMMANAEAQQQSAIQKGEQDREAIREKTRGQLENTELSKKLDMALEALKGLMAGTKAGESGVDKDAAAAAYVKSTQEADAIMMNAQPQPEIDPQQLAMEQAMTQTQGMQMA